MDLKLERLCKDERVVSARMVDGAVGVKLSPIGQSQFCDQPETLLARLGEGLDGIPVSITPDLPATWSEEFCSNEWPRFLSMNQAEDAITLVASLQPQLVWLGGHFPGEPILAGVVQLNWAIRLGSAMFPVEGQFIGVEALKFQHILVPGKIFKLTLAYSSSRQRLRFSYTHADGYYSQGRVRFGAEGSSLTP